METGDKGYIFSAIKRLISFGGLIFILVISIYYESQTNFFYYLGLEKRVNILSNLNELTTKDSVSQYLDKEICKIYNEIYDHTTYNFKEWRETIDKIPSWFTKDLPDSELEKKLSSWNLKMKN